MTEKLIHLASEVKFVIDPSTHRCDIATHTLRLIIV